MTRDPRSEAEKARADLKRNAELGHAVTQSPATRQPSVTPETFGEHLDEARARSGADQGAQTGSPAPGEDNDPQRGGYHHADTAMGTSHSQAIADFERAITGRDQPPEAPREEASRPRSRPKHGV